MEPKRLSSGALRGLRYGIDTRQMEYVRLRVKDEDFARAEILVRDGKGGGRGVTSPLDAM